MITQAHSTASRIPKDSILLQGKQDRGNPCVMALMDDVVTGALLLDVQD
jgi:hypothetical protein